MNWIAQAHVRTASAQTQERTTTVYETTSRILAELLTHSIHLRDCYKHARWQTTHLLYRGLHSLLAEHYAEQLRLVDVLIDRLQLLGVNHGVFAGTFLRQSQLACTVRRRFVIERLLEELLEAHEDALTAARPVGDGPEADCARDFALGQVVLSNDLQRAAILHFLKTQSKGFLPTVNSCRGGDHE